MLLKDYGKKLRSDSTALKKIMSVTNNEGNGSNRSQNYVQKKDVMPRRMSSSSSSSSDSKEQSGGLNDDSNNSNSINSVDKALQEEEKRKAQLSKIRQSIGGKLV